MQNLGLQDRTVYWYFKVRNETIIYDYCVRKKWQQNLLVHTLCFSMDHYSGNGGDSMANIFLLSVALISQKCVYSTLDVMNAFPSLGNHIAFTGNYSFTFVERVTVRVINTIQ